MKIQVQLTVCTESETSGNQLGQVTIDKPSSDEQEEDLGSKDSERLVAVSPETSASEGQVTIDDPMSGIQVPGDFPTEVSFNAVFRRVYQVSVCIGGRKFTGILCDQGPHTKNIEERSCSEEAEVGQLTIGDPSSGFLGQGNFPSEASIPAVFHRVQMDGGVDQFAYRTSVSIGGNMFTGILYDQGPHQETIEEQKEDSCSKEAELGWDILKLLTSVSSNLQENMEQEEDSGSKVGLIIPEVNPEASGNEGQVTIDDLSSENVEEPCAKETEQGLDVFNREISGVEGQVTIVNPSTENITEDLGSKENELKPEASENQGKVTIAGPSSENIEDSGSNENEQEPEASENQGQVTIADPSSENIEEEDSGPKGTGHCLGPVDPGKIWHSVSYEFAEFPYASLVRATDNFSDRISEGYYGSMYRGTLSGLNQEVAVKLLNSAITGYSNDEIANLAHEIARATNTNIVKFLGYCNEKLDRHTLVYEYIPITLASYLHDSPHMPPIDWATRMEIAYEVAKTLDYLHNTMRPRVIYGDLSSSNILLGDSHLKLCGFGIGKLRHTGHCKAIHTSCKVEVSDSCDVHCFGVVLLELLTGRKAYDVTRKSRWISEWVRTIFSINEELKALQDPRLKGKVVESSFGRALLLGLLCTSKQFVIGMDEVFTEMEYIAGKKVDNRLFPDILAILARELAEEEEEEDEEKTTNKSKKKRNKKNKKKKN